MNIIISGGGTGGHIYPALAIVDEIKKRYKDANILYVGTEKGLESEIVPEHGVPFKTISAKGLPRKKLNVKTFKTAMSLYKGLRQCDKIIKEFNRYRWVCLCADRNESSEKKNKDCYL